jgi:tetratricopeptide (TPR) repeat protein
MVSGFDSAFSTSYTTRGNVTGTTNYLLTNGTVTGSVAIYAQYDITGNAVKTVDAKGNPTDFNFADCYGTPNGNARLNSQPIELSSVGQVSYAFVTSVTNALAQTVYLARGGYYFWVLLHPVKAELDYRRAIKLSHGSIASAWAGLGDSLARIGRRDEAIAAYRKYLAVRPKSAAHYDGEIRKSIVMLQSWPPQQ